MDVEFSPTKKIKILSVDRREVEDLVWCAVTSGSHKLYWINGYLICTEVHDEAFKYEIEEGVFPISQLCYASLPNYTKMYEAEKGARIPVVRVTGMRIFEALVKKLKSGEGAKRRRV